MNDFAHLYLSQSMLESTEGICSAILQGCRGLLLVAVRAGLDNHRVVDHFTPDYSRVKTKR